MRTHKHFLLGGSHEISSAKLKAVNSETVAAISIDTTRAGPAMPATMPVT